MKTSRILLVTLIVSLVASGVARAADRALPNPFGVFNLRPFNELPAQEQVDLAMKSGYDGLMASTSTKTPPLVRLREFAAVPAVREGKFKIYAILWQVRVDKPVDQAFLKEFIPICKELNAALWCNVVGTPGEREVTLSLLKNVAEQCQAGGVQLVLYPHHACTFETAEESLEIWEKLKHPEIKLSLHLCHELKAKNLDRIDAIVAKILPHLALVSINGVDSTAPIQNKGWDGIIIPLHEGDFDVRPFVAAVAHHGYQGPILLHNFGFKAKPADYLPASMKRWREISADVAAQIAIDPAAKKTKSE
jgi:sugar phosphate isomerase/epimerase